MHVHVYVNVLGFSTLIPFLNKSNFTSSKIIFHVDSLKFFMLVSYDFKGRLHRMHKLYLAFGVKV